MVYLIKLHLKGWNFKFFKVLIEKNKQIIDLNLDNLSC